MSSLATVTPEAFQMLAQRLCEEAEELTPQEALDVLRTFSEVGSANEVLLQHIYLRLLLGRSFAELVIIILMIMIMIMI